MKARAKKKVRGRKTFAGVGDRLTKTQIARRSGLDRETVSKYLGTEGAPAADGKGRFSFKAAMAFFERISPRAANTEETRKIKESILRMEAEERGLDLGIKKGQYIERAKLEPAFAEFNAQLTADLEAKFYHELPQKYEGRSQVERAELNMEAIVWVLTRLKHGQAAVVPNA